jgi:solute carrier family 35 protein F1/2
MKEEKKNQKFIFKKMFGCSAKTKRTILSVVFGQLLSLFVSACGISSTLLADKYNVKVPTFQSFANYAVLALFALLSCAPVKQFANRLWPDERNKSILRQGDGSSIDDANEPRGVFWRRALLWYMPLALVDVEANFVVVLAFQYTDLASVMLLDCWAIPCVMAISHYFLGHRYMWKHYLGAFVCVLGIIVLVIADWVESGVAAGAKNALLGDVLVLVGATLYAVSNTGQEHMVSYRPRAEFMGMIGVFGTVFGGIQCVALERDAIAAISWSGMVTLLLVIFGVFQLAQYLLTPTMMRVAGAAFFNLSLLTSDTFSFIISVILFGRALTVQYGISALLIVIGIIVYQLAPEPNRVAPATASNNGSGNNSSNNGITDDAGVVGVVGNASLSINGDRGGMDPEAALAAQPLLGSDQLENQTNT